MTHSLRPAAVEDAAAAAELLLGLPDGLADMFGRGEVARRIARVAFEGPSTMLSHRLALVAQDGGAVVGLVVRFPGSQWAALRRRTATAMLRAAGVRNGPVLVWRGSILDRLIPGMPPGAMYVPALSVAPNHRGRGAGSAMLGRVIEEAVGLGGSSPSMSANGTWAPSTSTRVSGSKWPRGNGSDRAGGGRSWHRCGWSCPWPAGNDLFPGAVHTLLR